VTTPAAPIQSAGGAHHVSPAVEAAGALVWPSGEQQSWLYCSWGLRSVLLKRRLSTGKKGRATDLAALNNLTDDARCHSWPPGDRGNAPATR